MDDTRKTYYPETIDEEPLPETLVWESISNRPRSLKDLDPTAEAIFEQINEDFLSLGDLAYLDSISTTEISDNAITTPKLAAGSIIASKIAVGTITTTQLNATAIDGMTVTGALIRTSSGSSRVQLNNSNNSLQVYLSNVLRVLLDDDEISFYNSSGNKRGGITAGTTEVELYALNGGNIHMKAEGSSYAVIFSVNSVQKGYFSAAGFYLDDDMNMQNNNILACGDIEANDTTSDIGTDSIPFDNLFIHDVYFEPQSSNPTQDGQVRYYQSGGRHELRVQLAGTDYRFMLETPPP